MIILWKWKGETMKPEFEAFIIWKRIDIFKGFIGAFFEWKQEFLKRAIFSLFLEVRVLSLFVILYFRSSLKILICNLHCDSPALVLSHFLNQSSFILYLVQHIWNSGFNKYYGEFLFFFFLFLKNKYIKHIVMKFIKKRVWCLEGFYVEYLLNFIWQFNVMF